MSDYIDIKPALRAIGFLEKEAGKREARATAISFVKEQLITNKVTQEQLAKVCGMKPVSISAFLRGDIDNWSDDRVKKVLAAATNQVIPDAHHE